LRTPVPIERWHEPRDAGVNEDGDDLPWGEWTRRWGTRARGLAWKRRPKRKWPRWLSLQLARSVKKRWSYEEQPPPRWRELDTQAAELVRGREAAQRWLERWGLMR
jgi:hypothetical protein